MKDIEQMIELENIVREHKDSLSRLIAYSIRGLLTPDTFTLELVKMQRRTLLRCLKHVPESDMEKLIIEIEKASQ